jgi:hypothetical protein
MVAVIPLAPRRVQGNVSHHATIYELRLCVVADQGNTLRMGQLVGQGHTDLAGDLTVLAGLGFLDAVPQLGSVMDPIRRVIRCEDFGVIDTAPCGVIED